MNLLQVQDTLKNASDQQLMMLLQAPDSTAPSYLVLSEIRRRKDMRAKQTPDSNRTVAEELTAPQEPAGIQALQGQAPQGPMEPDGTDAAQGMAAGGLASLRRYQEGGVVRMQAGGQAGGLSPIIGRGPSGTESDLVEYPFMTGDQDQIIFGRPLHSYSLPELERLRVSERYLPGPAPGAPRVSALPMDAINRRISTLRGRNQPRFPESPSISENAPSFEALGGAPPAAATQPAGQTQTREDNQPSALGPDPYAGSLPGRDVSLYDPQAATPAALGGGAAAGAGAPASPPAGGAAASPPPAARQQSAAGIRSLAPAAGVAAPQEPNLADIMRRTGELFPDNMSGIRDRMREDRVDPAARRSEAVNMALIEAGLRIAGSRNPSLIGAIGEGALPAVQSYGQQLNQIRGEQRQSRQDELELAKQEVTRQFAIGQISSAEYRSRMGNINANARIAAQERGADRRAGASEAAADRRYTEQARRDERLAATRLTADTASRHGRGEYTPQEFAALSPEQQTFVRERFPASARSDLATQQEEARARAAIASNVAQSLRDPGTMEGTRAQLIAARRRENPENRNPVVTDADVENHLIQRALRLQQAASAYGRQGQQGSGGAAPVLSYDPNTRTIR